MISRLKKRIVKKKNSLWKLIFKRKVQNVLLKINELVNIVLSLWFYGGWNKFMACLISELFYAPFFLPEEKFLSG